ncbi:Protein FAM114A2 like [Actinidia chinensis var. chinensis]|uniref:Protein FAM114A2 like n=1 Tax=Actinidia chinensis var. chinensis TaxID=1590841 RepID=A0A2R6R1R5_ACTCC|nr:Protein FAM114A2 like [Actinidia chinensis var. chinensis]
MEDNTAMSPKEEREKPEEVEATEAEAPPPHKEDGGDGGGWGGWGFSPFSVFSDLQKAATVAAEEISRNAAEVAKTAAKSIADIQNVAEDSESSKEGDLEESTIEGEEEDEHNEQRKAALDKLEKASEDSLLGQSLKVLDTSVENIASGAWQALGSAWRGGSNLVHKIEHSAVNLAESIQQGGLPAPGSVAPSIIESGKAFTVKGMQVLELVGKEAMDLLITETGIDIDGNTKKAQPQDDEDQLFEEVMFDRCFYIYGGPEHLEELEALSNHYTLLFNRRKAKLSSEQKSFYEGKLKQVQQIFSLSSEIDESAEEVEKGKKIESGAEDSADEMKNLHDSSVRKAAEMAAGFTNTLAGLAANDLIQRTAGRLDSLHSEGVHRLSEMCCSAVSQLLMLAKSIISTANKAQEEDVDDVMLNINWPEDSIEKAKIIRTRAQSMNGKVEAVCNSFITGIADVAEAYVAAMKGAAADSKEVHPHKSIQEKADSLSKNFHSNRATAVGKIQDGLEYLTYIVLSTSMPVA